MLQTHTSKTAKIGTVSLVGATNVVCNYSKYADDTTLLVPEMCDVQIVDELSKYYSVVTC